jgi:hypothetical protein
MFDDLGVPPFMETSWNLHFSWGFHGNTTVSYSVRQLLAPGDVIIQRSYRQAFRGPERWFVFTY